MKEKNNFYTKPIDFINIKLYYNNEPVALAGQVPFQ